MKELISYADGVHAVDSGYGRPQLAAIHIVVQDGRAAIVDTGSNASVPPCKCWSIPPQPWAKKVALAVLMPMRLKLMAW